jgi:small conductance mechanosensitive channel
MKDPALQIAVVKLADSGVNVVVRPWVNLSDYWGVYMAVCEATKKAIDAEGINIPYPQRDVHVYQHQFHSLQSSN